MTQENMLSRELLKEKKVQTFKILVFLFTFLTPEHGKKAESLNHWLALELLASSCYYMNSV